MSIELQRAIELRRQLCERLASKTRGIERAVLIAILTSILSIDELKRLVETQNK